MSRDWRLYLEDIVASCERVERYVAGMSREQFFSDDRTYDAVVRNPELIGEAAKHIPEVVRQQMPSIEWRKISGFRDWLAHAYFGIDPDILWDVIEHKIRPLNATVTAYLLQSQAQ